MNKEITLRDEKIIAMAKKYAGTPGRSIMIVNLDTGETIKGTLLADAMSIGPDHSVATIALYDLEIK